MRRRGFTLFEVLVALGLILALLGVMFGFLADIQGSRRRALEFAARQRAATTLINYLERDLLTCLVEDAASDAGVKGDDRSLRILSRGVLMNAGREENEVWSDLQRSEYEFSPETGEIRMRRAAGEPGVLGERNESGFYPLGTRIGRVRFRYHYGGRWRDFFDSAEHGHLPRAVEVAIWFNPPDSGLREDESSSRTDLPPERATFDATAGFDEETFARESDLNEFAEPPPDRMRVILIPDSEVEEEEDSESLLIPGGEEPR